jgi:hypothetical protein
MFFGSFADDFNGFQAVVANVISTFKAQGITRLLIDLTNNGGQLFQFSRTFHFTFSPVHLLGGYVCLGQFLHQYLAGSSFGYP